ncbi:2-amino-4-hydroxy-6-hydroxymethyldihydropteridine diphosphokinase [Suttonella ornithocola]|uniref:2-amino-4-hydroxy-6-hydroxymethyldihydropteridine pyrophosphokinase n=2 Tax=Suttonella ornithocola TaxID=279832 RepID=A0A380MW97_9GAMM|nr:2-amino-4-hydroxy-6-hydroxymethyldihydropteridine diphosphokinase [Suttonella ornithocola]SUO96839.1 2-amino-4-hydroxy-6-hydroxymethyldihydropteridinepyrophosphokinase [Suttonella ornithocola]
MHQHHTWIAFGSNQDQPIQQLLVARNRLAQHSGVTEIKASSLYKTPPWGYEQQPDFYNAVIHYKTNLSPLKLLELLQTIEQEQHRMRTIKNGPRTLDLDILLFDNETLETDLLTLPHPRMHERAFVIQPLTEISPNICIGKYGKAEALLKQLDTSHQTKLKIEYWK